MIRPTTETAPRDPKTAQRSVLVSGGTGLVGGALLARLAQRGDETATLTRSRRAPDDVGWDPARGTIDDLDRGFDAVVHLAGESIAAGRWTRAKMERIRKSRVDGTRVLAERLAELGAPPATFVCASAIGFYGDRGDEVLTESAPAGQGFLADVCREWEAACAPLEAVGTRVVLVRIGVVLATGGGALPRMLTPFRLGLGGKLGSGRQYVSWITLDDLASVLERALDDERLVGAVNGTAPNPVTNAELTRALGRVLRRPTFAPLPAPIARLVLGRMADDLLLASTRVVPERLNQTGFEFAHPEIEGALRAVLERPA